MSILSVERNAFLKFVPEGNGICLDVGGGTAPIKPHMERNGYRYFNFDIEQKVQVDIRGNANLSLPFVSRSLSLVVTTHSIEHLRDPRKFFNDVHRVLESGGLFVGLVPFLHPYHDKDYWRPTHYGLHEYLTESSFRAIKVKSVTGPLTAATFFPATLLNKLRLGVFSRGLLNSVAWVEKMFITASRWESNNWAHSLIFKAQKASEN